MSTKKGIPLSKIYKSNVKAENEGIWVELQEGIEVKIRSAQSLHAAKVYKELIAPYKKKAQRGNLPESVTREINAMHLAKGILVDWKGFYGEDEKEIPFSVQAAYDLLIDPAYTDLLLDISEAATAREAFRAEEEETDTKN